MPSQFRLYYDGDVPIGFVSWAQLSGEAEQRFITDPESLHGSNSGLCKRTRPLSHRPIFEIHDPVWGRAADEFSDKGAPDIVLLNCAKRSRNQAPQPSCIARRVSIARDYSRTKNREALEAYPLNRLFFQPHDPHIANPAFRGASHCREQRKPCDTPGLTTAGKATDHANFEGL